MFFNTNISILWNEIINKNILIQKNFVKYIYIYKMETSVIPPYSYQRELLGKFVFLCNYLKTKLTTAKAKQTKPVFSWIISV
jgi:lipid-A-disaccharide synthase-like uncharacterized protein